MAAWCQLGYKDPASCTYFVTCFNSFGGTVGTDRWVYILIQGGHGSRVGATRLAQQTHSLVPRRHHSRHLPGCGARCHLPVIHGVAHGARAERVMGPVLLRQRRALHPASWSWCCLGAPQHIERWPYTLQFETHLIRKRFAFLWGNMYMCFMFVAFAGTCTAGVESHGRFEAPSPFPKSPVTVCCVPCIAAPAVSTASPTCETVGTTGTGMT